MTHRERTIDLLLFVQRYPRTFPDISDQFPKTSGRTLYLHLADAARRARTRQARH